jgi:hypothetical protein
MRRNSVLKKRERKYYEEIKKKLNWKIFNKGMDVQTLIHQFHGEQDRFNVNKDQRKYFKRFANLFYSWAENYYVAREKDIGFIKKPARSVWYDW